MAKLLVTAYANPDIDRAGCMIAYAEFLTKTGTNAVWGIFGVPQREPQFVYTYLKITPPVAALYLPEYQNIVIVDGSDIRWIPPEIPLENIVEVIDHRKQNDAQKFTNAMIQIELVGAAATLIVEKYIAHNLPISYESALFVYAAIISNTINFKADVTTDRDRSAAQWLLDHAPIPQSFIHEMFTHKSTVTEPLKDILEKEFTWYEFNAKKIGIAQIEIAQTKRLYTDLKTETEDALQKIKEEKFLDYIFLTAIDIEEGTNTFITVDKGSQEIVANTLKCEFTNNVAMRSSPIMRKSIIPLVRDYMEKHLIATLES